MLKAAIILCHEKVVQGMLMTRCISMLTFGNWYQMQSTAEGNGKSITLVGMDFNISLMSRAAVNVRKCFD